MGGRPVRFLSKIPIDNFVLGIIAGALLATALPARGVGEPIIEWVTYAAEGGLFATANLAVTEPVSSYQNGGGSSSS